MTAHVKSPFMRKQNLLLCLVKKALYNGLLIPLLYGICAAIVAHQHSLFSEFDGAMHYFSGMDIYNGNGYRGWGSHFWPPLYPLLTGALAMWMDGPAAGELISVASAALLLWVAHRFVYRLTGNDVIACLAQLLIATNYTFVLLSIKSENHMLDSLFYVWAILLLLQSLDQEKGTRYFVVGLVCGLAGLSRYTSYSLVPAFVITLFFFYPPRRAILLGMYLLAGFILVSAPWWILNYQYNGSPVSTWQYMNIGKGVFSDEGSKWWWYWDGIDTVRSVSDIVLQAPVAYMANFLRNVAKSIYLIVFKSQLTGMICLASLGYYIFRQHNRYGVQFLRERLFLPVLIALVCYIMLVSQAFVFSEVFLSWLVLVVIYGAYAIYRLNPGIRLFGQSYRPVILALVALIIGLDVVYTSWQLNRYMKNAFGLEENRQIVAAIKAHDSNLDQRLVMSFHPARAYYLGSSFIMLPPYYKGDVSGLVSFQGMSFKVKDHAPRFPSTINVNNLKVDYLIYDRVAAGYLSQFSFLLDKNSHRIPSNFQLVYLSSDVAVYKINGHLVHREQ